jgi:asparagine synthase (glutamine-hydrolysing)
VAGLLPESFSALDSHQVVRQYLGPLDGRLCEPEVLHKIPYLEMKLRLAEHLLMRVDKLTMAHAVEARVPFLDHDVVDFATRLPPSYKLRDGVGKRILKKAAEPYLDHDMIYRRKQGFGVRAVRSDEGRLLRQRVFRRVARAADERLGRTQFSFVDRAERRAVARVLGGRAAGMLLIRAVGGARLRRRVATGESDQ